MTDIFKANLELQNSLNIETAGVNWTSGVSKDLRVINWRRCLYMELAEGLDSLNWKHWKNLNAPEDIPNLKIEIVDSWHFIQSLLIEEFGLNQAEVYINQKYKQFLNIGSLTKESLIIQIENLIRKSINNEEVLLDFFVLVHSIPDFDIETLQSLYIGKNCLNKFRLNHGYKEGTYSKIWNGSEDNVFMQNLIQENKSLTYSSLYNKLEERYQTL